MEPKERIQELTKLLNDAGYRYYVLDDPDMPDFDTTVFCGSWRTWRKQTRSLPCRILPPSGWAVRL